MHSYSEFKCTWFTWKVPDIFTVDTDSGIDTDKNSTGTDYRAAQKTPDRDTDIARTFAESAQV